MHFLASLVICSFVKRWIDIGWFAWLSLRILKYCILLAKCDERDESNVREEGGPVAPEMTPRFRLLYFIQYYSPTLFHCL
jgi:hypothetical protein